MDKLVTFDQEAATRTMPEFKTGDTVRVHQKIKEGNKERVQIFEGVIIKIRGGFNVNGTFTVRKVTNGVGVEKIFPFQLPTIEKIELVKRGKTRRSKLYYLRDKQPKEARLKDLQLSEEEKEKLSFDAEKHTKKEEVAEEKPETEETPKEEVKEEEPKKEESTEKKEPEAKAETKEEKKEEKKDESKQ